MRFSIVLLLLLGALQGLGAFLATILVQADPKNAVFLGFSAARLALLMLLLVLALALLLLSLLAARSKRLRERLSERLLQHRKITLPILAALALASYVLIMLPGSRFGAYQFHHQRLLPALVWLCLFSIELALWTLQDSLQRWTKKEIRAVLRPSLRPVGFSIAAVLLLAAWIRLSGTGIRVDALHWEQAGTPILAWQFQLSLLAALCAWLAGGVTSHRAARPAWQAKAVDILIFLAIWGLSAFTWNSLPLSSNDYTTFNEQTSQFYPVSDARRYAFMGQSVLHGQSVLAKEDKLLYILFLSGIQRFTGLDYLRTVSVQSALLALLPALLFVLGKLLRGRDLGLLLAGMALFKEMNAIRLEKQLALSHSKVLMTEVPAELIAILLTIAVFLWLQNLENRPSRAVWAGLALGAACLTRLNFYLFGPALVFFSFLRYWQAGKMKAWLPAVSHFTLATLLVVVPWNVYTIRDLGMPYSLSKYVKSLEGREFPVDLPGLDGNNGNSSGRAGVGHDGNGGYDFHRAEGGYEKSGGYDTRPTVGDGDSQDAEGLGFVSIVLSHQVHNSIMTAFMLPFTFQYQDLDFLMVKRMWIAESAWNGRLNPVETVRMLINLVLLGAGIGLAIRRFGLTGLVPLFLHLGYHLSNGLARTSGGRYLIPVEWGLYLYYALAALSLAAALARWLGARGEAGGAEPAEPRQTAKRPPALLLPLGAGLLVLILLLPKGTQYRSYGAEEVNRMLQQLDPTGAEGIGLSSLQAYLAEEDHFALSGKVLYPAMEDEIDKHPHGGWIAIAYPHLSFSFISPELFPAIFPLEEVEQPLPLQAGAEVILVGCKTNRPLASGSYLEAALLIVLEDGQPVQLLRASGSQEIQCPLVVQ